MRKMVRIQSARKRPKRLICRLALFLNVFIIPGGNILAAANTSPTIRLFPTTVVENIKHTGEAAKAMEAAAKNEGGTAGAGMGMGRYGYGCGLI